MDEKEYGYRIDFAFLEKDENVLAVLLFGSGAKDQLSTRSQNSILQRFTWTLRVFLFLPKDMGSPEA